VSLCPVNTPAGGLVRVVSVNADGSTTTLLDDSYTKGTGPCSLETKMRWKLADKKTRGPAPFKVPRPASLWNDRVNELLKAVGDPEPSFSGFFGACAPLDVELKRRKDSGEIKGNPSALDLIALLEEDEQLKVLPAAGSAVQSLASATETSDAAAVADWKAIIKKESQEKDCAQESC